MSQTRSNDGKNTAGEKPSGDSVNTASGNHSGDTIKYESQEQQNEEESSPIDSQSPPSLEGKESRWFRFSAWSCVKAVAVLVVAVLSVFFQPNLLSLVLAPSLDSAEHLDGKINTYIHNWQSNYPNQHLETWGTIAGQLQQFTDIGNVSPLVIVLAYSKAQKTAMMLASEISHAALQLINVPDNCGDMDIAKLSGSDINIKGEYLLNNYLPQIKKCRKMIMMNLEKLNETAAKDLHSMLDPDYPNIPNVVYIFTVKIPSTEGNVYKEVRQVLTSKWSAKLGDDRVNALMSRLVSNVEVIPEPFYE